MEQFLYLIKDTGVIKTLSPLQMQDYLQQWKGWIAKLNDSQCIIVGEPVEPSGKQIKGKDKWVVETSEEEQENKVRGFFLVNALNWEDAIEIAKGCPVFEMDGNIEVKIIRRINLE